MYKLSELRVTDPCKKCIVKPMCSKACKEFIKRKNFSDIIYTIKGTIHNIFKVLFKMVYWFIYCISSIIKFIIVAIFLEALMLILLYCALFGVYQIWMLWKDILT